MATITRKTDRRTIYTHTFIKEGLLKLLEATPFDKLTVTSLCKEAEITRATFYLHYDDLSAVIDELINEALQLANTNPTSDFLTDVKKMLHLINEQTDLETLQAHTYLLPPCQRIADHPKYHVLFTDEMLSGYILKKIIQTKKNEFVKDVTQHYALCEKEAEMLFLFILHGAYAINKSMQWKKDETWFAVQAKLITFMLGGYHALEK